MSSHCTAIIIATIAFASSGCRRSSPETPSSSASLPADDTGVDPAIADYFTSFQSVRVQVLDAATSEPIEAADLRVVCMGGTPHAEDRARTDDEGYASINYRTGNYAAVDVSAERYAPWTGLVPTDSAVVRLERIPK